MKLFFTFKTSFLEEIPIFYTNLNLLLILQRKNLQKIFQKAFFKSPHFHSKVVSLPTYFKLKNPSL